MKIAVTYQNGLVFQHFGHSEAFKIYEIENGEVKNAEVAPTNGSGHGALAGFLKQHGVNALICGGIGGCRSGHRVVSRCFRQRGRGGQFAAERHTAL